MSDKTALCYTCAARPGDTLMSAGVLLCKRCVDLVLEGTELAPLPRLYLPHSASCRCSVCGP